jgi:hypothetical protein
MFIARISRGRTVREIINYTMTGPLFFCFLWFGVFGGAAIQMENQAQMLWKAGVELYNDPSYFQTGQGVNKAADFTGGYVGFPAPPAKAGFGSEPRCWKKIVFNETDSLFPGYCGEPGTALAGSNEAGCVPLGFKAQGKGESAYESTQGCGACFVQQATFGNSTHAACDIHRVAHPCTTDSTGMETCPPCPFWIKSWKADPALSPQCLFTDYDHEASWYNVVGQFYEIGAHLQALSILALTLYFITSSGSGSLVVDTLSAGGRDEQNPIQRVLWALIEGLVATGLVLGGAADENTSAKNVLKALQPPSAAVFHSLFFCAS